MEVRFLGLEKELRRGKQNMVQGKERERQGETEVAIRIK